MQRMTVATRSARVLATVALVLGGCSQPAASPTPASGAPSATAANPAAATNAPSGAATGQSVDPDVQKAYDDAAKLIPGLSIDTVAAAKREGALSIYKVAYNLQGGMYQEFNKLFPFLKITDFEGSATAVLDRFTTEARANRTAADIGMVSGNTQPEALDTEGLLMHFDPSTATKFSIGGKSGAYWPLGRYQLCNAYNADLVSESDAEVLQKWEGVVDRRWEGKAAMISFQNGINAILPYYFALYERGQPFFDQMLAQKPLAFVAVPSMVERLGAGGASVLFFANEGNLGDLQKRGAPIRWRCPEPSLAIPLNQFIARDAPHPNAAKLWVAYTLTKSAQSTLMATTGVRSAREDMDDERPITKESWYKPPTTLYAYDEPTIYKAASAIGDAYKRQPPQEIK